MKMPEQKTRTLTPQDVRDIVGDLDDAKIAAILATDASPKSSRRRPLGRRGERRDGRFGAAARRRGRPAVRHPDGRRGASRGPRLAGRRSPSRRKVRADTYLPTAAIRSTSGYPRSDWTVFWVCRGRPWVSFSSRTAAVAVASARATITCRRCSARRPGDHCCSTCSRRREAADRRNVFDIDLLAEAPHAGHELGKESMRRPRACRSAILAPVPARRRRWSPRRRGSKGRLAPSSRRRPSRPGRRGCSAKCGRRRCSSWAARIRSVLELNSARRSTGSDARRASRSCLAPHTCSRSRARSIKSSTSPGSGSSDI